MQFMEIDLNPLKDSKMIDIGLGECDGEPEPSCFSSVGEFRYRGVGVLRSMEVHHVLLRNKD